MPTTYRTLLSACILSLATVPSQADYPVASHRYLADPSALVHDGRVYVYCSNDDDNITGDRYLMSSIVCVSSEDLKNWTDHGPVIRAQVNAAWATKTWAPSALEKDGTFYLYFPNGGSNIGVATSDSPAGPFQDAIGGPLIHHSTPGASGENQWLFDPGAYMDDDGQAYLYFGGNGESNIRVIKLADDLISTEGAATRITGPGFFEASWVHKRDGVYYFSYSTNPQNGIRIDYMTSDNPTDGFKYAGVLADQPPSNNGNNNHHSTFKLGDSWYHVYHSRFVANEAGKKASHRRSLGVEKIYYNDDNTMKKVVYTRNGLKQLKPLDPFQRVEAETFASQKGIETVASAEGGMAITQVSHGDYIALRGVDFKKGVSKFQARVAGSPGGQIEIRIDAVDGPIIATCEIPNTGSLTNWTDVKTKINPHEVLGEKDLYFVFRNPESDNFLSWDWWKFQ